LFYPAGADGPDQRAVVALTLDSIEVGKLGQRSIEGTAHTLVQRAERE
jgi:hypothetical protein